MKLWTLIFAAAVALAGFNAEAARLGGGRSMGKQSNSVVKREAPAPATAPGAANAAKPATPAAAVAPKRPWGAMLGGLAAGLGLAWLAHSLGFGEAFGQVLMFALLAMVLMAAFGWYMRNRKGAQRSGSAPFAFQGAGGAPISEPRPYRPENVGNDASARPWERSSSMALEPLGTARTSESMIGSVLVRYTAKSARSMVMMSVTPVFSASQTSDASATTTTSPSGRATGLPATSARAPSGSGSTLSSPIICSR